MRVETSLFEKIDITTATTMTYTENHFKSRHSQPLIDPRDAVNPASDPPSWLPPDAAGCRRMPPDAAGCRQATGILDAVPA